MTKRTQPFRRTLSKAALVAVAALALGACGSSTGSSAPKGEPARIRISSGAGASASTLAGGAPEASGKIAAGADISTDMAMLPFQRTEYVVGGELPTLDGEAPAWHYPAEPAIAKADVASVARALGLTGDVEEVPADQGGGFRVGAADFSGPVLTVSGDAAGSWFYSGGVDDSVRTSCAGIAKGEPAPDEPVSSDGSGATPAAEPADAATTIADPNCVQELPKNVPSDDAARDKATDLAKKLGSKPFGAVEVAGDEYGRYATWTTKLSDDLANPMGWSAAYGAEGRLISASGYLVEPQAAAPYPRIGTAAAVKQLQDGTAFFGGGVLAMDGGAATSGVASDDVASSDGGESPAASGTASAVPATAVAPPQPADTATTIADPNTTMVVETVPDTTLPARQVSITGAKAGLYSLYGVDGDIWLVPAYVFATSDGDITVPAIDQSYVEAVNPPVVADDTVGGDASGGSSGSDGSGSAPAGGPVAQPEPAVVTTVPEPATTTG